MHTRLLVENGSFREDDRIFLGEGLFETLKVAHGKPCHSQLHWARMQYSAQQLGMAFDLSLDDWIICLSLRIKQDNLYHGGIKVILSGGSAPRGLAAHGPISQLMLHTFSYTKQSNPYRLISSSWLRDSSNPIYQFKSVNYLEAIIARRYALNHNADDVLFFNTQHHATETTCANFFVIKNNALYTPPIEDGVLPGVTRLRIRNLCLEQQINYFEQSITKAMLADAQALFTTNSLQGIHKVHALDDRFFELDNPLLRQLISFVNRP